MAWPLDETVTLVNDGVKTDATATATDHAKHHNDLATACEDLVTFFGTNPAQGPGGVAAFPTVGQRIDQLECPAVSTVTNADKTIGGTDSATLQGMNSSVAHQVLIPTDAAATLPIGFQASFFRQGTGTVTIVASTPGTTTVVSTGATPAAPVLRAQYSVATLAKVGANLWLVTGDIA